jgi:hypothetical protein
MRFDQMRERFDFIKDKYLEEVSTSRIIFECANETFCFEFIHNIYLMTDTL